MDNAREQLRALMAMVVEQLGQTQDTLAKATALSESVDAQRLAALSALGSARSLMHTAVGDSPVLPKAATDMLAAAMAAHELLDVEIRHVVGRLKDLVGEVHGQVGAAVQSANDYVAAPW